jgi:hypothetical protein
LRAKAAKFDWDSAISMRFSSQNPLKKRMDIAYMLFLLHIFAFISAQQRSLRQCGVAAAFSYQIQGIDTTHCTSRQAALATILLLVLLTKSGLAAHDPAHEFRRISRLRRLYVFAAF